MEIKYSVVLNFNSMKNVLLGSDNKEVGYQCNDSYVHLELPSLNINKLLCLNTWVLRLNNALK